VAVKYATLNTMMMLNVQTLLNEAQTSSKQESWPSQLRHSLLTQKIEKYLAQAVRAQSLLTPTRSLMIHRFQPSRPFKKDFDWQIKAESGWELPSQSFILSRSEGLEAIRIGEYGE